MRLNLRGFLMVALAAVGFAIATPNVASAADGCGRGRAWNGWQCVWVAPRVYAPPVVGFYGGHRWHGHRHHWHHRHHHHHRGHGHHHRRHR